jgi:hypothetical protein
VKKQEEIIEDKGPCVQVQKEKRGHSEGKEEKGDIYDFL